MKYLLFAILIIWVISDAPIPQRPDGYIYKPSPLKKIRIDTYEDLLWSACKAFEPVFMEYLNTSKFQGKSVTDFIEVAVHIFPLPYHHHAFYVSQLVPFIYDLNKNNTQVFEYIKWAFDNQDDYLDGSVSLNMYQVQDKLCHNSAAALKFYTKSQCDQEFDDDTHDMDTRVSWKFGAYNGINGTPTVLLNGVPIDAPDTVEEWNQLLTPYLQ